MFFLCSFFLSVIIILYCRSNNGLRNTEQQKISKYINTRVTEVFPVRKARNLGKENCKVRLRFLSILLNSLTLKLDIWFNGLVLSVKYPAGCLTE